MLLAKLRGLTDYALYYPERPRYQSRTMRHEWVAQDEQIAERYNQWRAQRQADQNTLLGSPRI